MPDYELTEALRRLPFDTEFDISITPKGKPDAQPNLIGILRRNAHNFAIHEFEPQARSNPAIKKPPQKKRLRPSKKVIK